MRSFTQLPPLSLYIHLPWCIKKCPYCDFNSHEAKTELPVAELEGPYVDALLDDLAQEMPDIWGRSLSSVFIGGGTPSLFSAAALDRLLSGVRALTALSPDVEVTLEANPGTFEQERFRDYRQIGINRLSIGIQSFNDAALSALGRVHNSAEAERAVHIAREAGFDNLNLDLMFGLPGQSIETGLDDIQRALDLQPEHLSYYELTMEPNTFFARYPPDLPDDEVCGQIHTEGMRRLAEHGYHRYEVSAFARHDKRSVHNQNYWLFGDYVGIGAGAHGKISFANRGEIVRRWKLKHPSTYMKAAATADRIGGETVVSAEDTALEFMMNAMRLPEGFSLPLFQAHTGMALDRWNEAVSAAMEAGLLEQHGMTFKPSSRGLDFLNDLLAHFMPDSGSDGNAALEKSYPVIPLLRQP